MARDGRTRDACPMQNEMPRPISGELAHGASIGRRHGALRVASGKGAQTANLDDLRRRISDAQREFEHLKQPFVTSLRFRIDYFVKTTIWSY